MMVSSNPAYEKVPKFYLDNFPGLFNPDQSSFTGKLQNGMADEQQYSGTLPKVNEKQARTPNLHGGRLNSTGAAPKTANSGIPTRKRQAPRSSIRANPMSNPMSYESGQGLPTFSGMNTTKYTAGFGHTRNGFNTMQGWSPAVTNIDLMSDRKHK